MAGKKILKLILGNFIIFGSFYLKNYLHKNNFQWKIRIQDL